MHLRMPSIDQGVQSFFWAALFFLLLWLGMLAFGVGRATALILALVAACVIFLYIRLTGEDRPGSKRASNSWTRSREMSTLLLSASWM